MVSAIDPSTLHIVQITDCHLAAQPHTQLLDIDTDASVNAVLDLIRREQKHCDLLLATGDLSDQGSAAAYLRLRDYTKDFTPARWLPGNHDSAAVLRETLHGDDRIARVFRSAHWQIVMLDSSVPHNVEGHLAATELDALRACLREHPHLHTLICIHHPVLPVGAAWLDRQRVGNAEKFWQVVGEFSNVRAVVCGHVHQPFDRWHDNVRVLASPSTAWQFAPNSADFAVDSQAPGYRWLHLHADGRIDTDIARVDAHLFSANIRSAGY